MKERKGTKKSKLKEPKNALCNIEMFYKGTNNVIKFFDDYSSMASEAKHEATKGTEFRILTPSQILQRLPIALAQVKAGSNSENLLNEIRQIVYSMCQSKEITKKVYNDIIKSVQNIKWILYS